MTISRKEAIVGNDELKDREAAIFNLKCLAKKDPENAQVHLRLGALLSESPSTQEIAIKSLRSALSLSMNSNAKEATQMRREATSRLVHLMQLLEK